MSKIESWNHLPLSDLSHAPGRLYHIPCMASVNRSSFVWRGQLVRLVSDVREGVFTPTSDVNIPGVQKSCVESVDPRPFLAHVFAVAAKGPAVRQMLQVLVGF
jgi:hypothetical protein